jgi:AcrR family transcriptional regulator
VDAREKILETAMRLFATQGYSTTSLAQVAKEAHVSKALIFWHFDNKEALFHDAVQRTLEPYLINVLDDLEGLAEDEQLRHLIEEYYAFVAKHPDSVKLVLGVLLRGDSRPDDFLGRLTELHRVYRDLLADVLERGRRRGIFRDSVRPELDASVVMTALHGILLQRLLGDDTTRSGELLERLRNAFVDTLRR